MALTAGTILHNTKIPLTVWFWAAYLMATENTWNPSASDRQPASQPIDDLLS